MFNFGSRARTSDSTTKRLREMWDDEISGAALYRTLAEHADEGHRGILSSLAEAEEQHAGHWARLLAERGIDDLRPRRLRFRVRVLSFFARRLGSEAVLPLVLRLEAGDADKYTRVPEAPAAMVDQERAAGRVVAALGGDTTGERIARAEGKHRASVGGALRAAVFGVNDGLVSNFLLVIGVAGGTSRGQVVLLVGVAGWIAGACSMALGEWVSVRSVRELYEHEIEVERYELEHFPAEEREELALIYQAKGMPSDEAHALAQTLVGSDQGLDALVREELGLDPNGLGSPVVAAGFSFASFSAGALLPVLPFLVASGAAALAASAAISVATVFGVGALISVFTGSGPVRTGARMVGVSAVAAAVSFSVGRLIGTGISG